MENKNIIIILIVIIVILAAAIGFAMFNPMHAKEPTKIKITSDKEQYEGGELSIQLTDLNKTPLSKEVVNVTITNSKGKVVVDQVVKKLDLDLKKGKYKVNATYEGNENYTGNKTTQKLTIKEEIVEAEQSSQSQSSSSSFPQSSLDPDGDGYYYTVESGGLQQHMTPEREAQERKSFYENVPSTGMR